MAKKFTAGFADNWKYVRGENHWPTPTNQYHMTRDDWKAKTVRNRLFAGIDQKAAMVLDAEPTVHAEPVDDQVTTEQLEMAAAVVKAEMKRLRYHEVREDVFLEGSVNGKSFAHFYTKPDKLAQAMGIEQSEICVELADSTRCYPDPSATRLSQCRYFIYEPELDFSRAIEAFEKVAPNIRAKLKPTKGPVVADLGAENAITRGRSDDELVNGPGGDLTIGKDGKVYSCKLNIPMVWIKDDMIYEEVKQSWDSMGTPTTDSTSYSRAFPYGRLLATSGDYLLFDGESPYEITEILPFAEYTHYRCVDRFWSPGDCAMNKSAQMVADKTMAIALDGARLNMFGNLEVPIGADGYTDKGNAPGEIVHVPPELSGMAHVVQPENTNMQLLTWMDETNKRDFADQFGVSDVLSGGTPVAPTSGKELQTRAKLAATRPGRHMGHMDDFDSDALNILFQLMRQCYVGERQFMVPGLNGEMQAIRYDVSLLPPGIAIRVTTDPDEIEKDALEGQNVQALVSTGLLFNPMMIPLLPILLPSYGIRPQKAKELQRMVVGMVAAGTIPTDPATYQLITGAPMPPDMVAAYQMQMQMQAQAASQESEGEKEVSKTGSG